MEDDKDSSNILQDFENPGNIPVEESKTNKPIENQNNSSKKSDDAIFKIKIEKKEKEKRDHISLKDKERIVKAFEEGTDYLDLGQKLGIKESTVRGIIGRWQQSGMLSKGKRGGSVPRAITADNATRLLEYVEAYPLRTLREMRNFLQDLGCFPSNSSIVNYLDGQCVSIIKKPKNSVEAEKLAAKEAEDFNSEEVKTRRHSYVKSIIDNGIAMNQCIFVGEYNFNFWIRSPYGKNTKSTREFKHCCGQPENDVTVCVAIAVTGVIYFKICMGPMTKCQYEAFIMDLSVQLGDETFYIIQESTPVHPSVVTAYAQHQMVFLPPHSPFLNPLSQVFAKFKSLVRQKLPKTTVIIKLSISARKNLLKKTIEEIIPSEFYSSMSVYYSSIVEHYSRCIDKLDIIF